MVSKTKELRTSIITLSMAVAFFILTLLLHADYDIRINAGSFLGAHTALEFFSIAVSYFIALQGWLQFPYTLSRRYILIGAVFLAIGSLDLMHTLSYKGMPVFINGNQVQLTTWFWLAARLTEAVCCLLILNRENVSVKKNGQLVYAAAILYILAVSLMVIKYNTLLPLLFAEGSGVTDIKITIEYFIGVLHFMTMILIFCRSTINEDSCWPKLFTVFGILLMSELFFTLYEDVYAIENFLGHVYKVVGYYLLLQAIFVPNIVEPYIRAKQTEEQLDRQAEKFRNAFEYSGIGLSLVDMDGKWIQINKALCDMVGYTREEILGIRFQDITYAEDIELNMELLRRAISGEITRFQMKKRYIKKSGGIVWATINVVLMRDAQRTPLYFITQIQDITKRVEAQEKAAYLSLERRRLEQEMVRLDRLHIISEMAASISHEVRNPMTTVRGFLQMLSAKPETSRFKSQFQLMIEELDRANNIITEFLSIGKNKAVEQKIQNINSVIEALLPLIQADALEQGKYMEAILGEVDDVMLNDNEIRQVILNLARNGLDAMARGGCLTIYTFKDNADTVLAIQDQGSGIPPEIAAKIGTPFFTTKETGTGLGLGVCFDIARRHNAVLDYKTGAEGTTFYVRFKVNN